MQLYVSVVLVIYTLCPETSSTSLKQLMRNEWHEFKLTHQKSYVSAAEEQYRYNVYLDNRDMIARHNQRFALGLETYEMGANHLTDMTHEEIIEQFTGFDSPEIEDLIDDLELEGSTMLEAFDWRQKLNLGHVKNQRRCGSCWAFTALTTVEHHLHIHKGVKVDLSEQQLIDCSKSFGNFGCSGGWTNSAYKYIMKNGIAKESDYPYQARDGSCRYRPEMQPALIKGYKSVQGEAAMQRTLETSGPLSVAVHASKKFAFYKSGVFNEPRCSKGLNHGVVIVGHGQQEKDQYWIVQNSWGQAWGNKGYILMAKNKDNQCGINSAVSYPVV